MQWNRSASQQPNRKRSPALASEDGAPTPQSMRSSRVMAGSAQKFRKQRLPAFALAGGIDQRLQPFARFFKFAVERGIRLGAQQQVSQRLRVADRKITGIAWAKEPNRSRDAGRDHRHRNRQGFRDNVGAAFQARGESEQARTREKPERRGALQVAEPEVTRVASFLGPRLRGHILAHSRSRVHNLDARGWRQRARGERGLQRVLYRSQVGEHANLEGTLLRRDIVTWRSCRLIDHPDLIPRVFGKRFGCKRLESHQPGRQSKRRPCFRAGFEVGVEVGAGQSEDEWRIGARATEALNRGETPARMERDQQVALFALPLLCDIHLMAKLAQDARPAQRGGTVPMVGPRGRRGDEVDSHEGEKTSLDASARAKSGPNIPPMRRIEIAPSISQEPRLRRPGAAAQDFVRAKPGLGVFLVGINHKSRIRAEIAARPLPDITDHLAAAEGAIASSTLAHIHCTQRAPTQVGAIRRWWIVSPWEATLDLGKPSAGRGLGGGRDLPFRLVRKPPASPPAVGFR